MNIKKWGLAAKHKSSFQLSIVSTTLLLNGCAVVSLADTVVGVGASVVGTTVSVGSAVISTTADVAKAGVSAVTSGSGHQ